MRKSTNTLTQLGLSEKEITVYLTLLTLGPASVRKIGEKAGINRGTTHDALKSLQQVGLVSYYHKEKRQYFVAEDPAVIKNLIKNKKLELQETEDKLKEIIPELRSIYSEIEEKPVVKYYEGNEGTKTILQNVLDTTKESKTREYSVYSSSNIRPHLYKSFPNYTEERIKKGISVKAIAIGAGGEKAQLSKRRWLTKKGGAPTYTLIYSGKVAMISVDKKDTPRGVIIEDQHLFETQQILFNALWKNLK